MKLYINGKNEPFGTGRELCFNWYFESYDRNVYQNGYRLAVFADSACIYDSGKVEDQTCRLRLSKLPLLSDTCYRAELTVWMNTQETGEATASFVTGKLEEEWSGKWITGPGPIDDDGTLPPYIFNKMFQVRGEVKQAMLHASALGCYVPSINGARVTEEYFAPGYTQYDKRVLYNSYDVTAFLKQGENRISAEVSGGWYCGRLGLTLKRNRYGRKRAFLAELHILYCDGTGEIVASDNTWRVTTDGPRRFADFFDGEVYEAQRCDSGSWCWEQAKIYEDAIPKLEPYNGAQVLLHDKIEPVVMKKTERERYIIDFGRNIAGVVGLWGIEGKSGQKIRIRHGEVLNSDGSLYTNNLRTAKAQIWYTCKDGVQSYKPAFTYMGFRYVEVTGIDELQKEQIAAFDLYSDLSLTGIFHCSNEEINLLQRNILISQKANFVDIPTDCPQRDERCGWTGDIAMFLPTACFNMDTSLFMGKWLRDVELAQRDNGAVPQIVPTNGISRNSLDGMMGVLATVGSAAWGDVITFAPWTLYWVTGDVTVLERQYTSMVRWVEYERRAAEKWSVGQGRYIWSHSFQFGDWLAPGESIIDNMRKGKWIATAYFARSAWILGRTARILGKEQDARKYHELFLSVRDAFRRRFLDRKGHIRNGFQSIYVLAVYFNLLTKREKQIAVADLVEDIRAKKNHLATGFPGTPFLNFVLSDNGYADVAYELLLQKTAPGWLYPIRCGATSIWERWDALKEDGTVNDNADINMVSFNHYAYGAVGDWLYKRVAGLVPVSPGYKRFKIQPLTGGGLTEAEISYLCPYGRIESAWFTDGDVFNLRVTVPCNTTAEIILPDGRKHICGSGTYSFSCNTL